MAKAEIIIAEMRNLVSGLDEGLFELRTAKSVLTNYTSMYAVDHTLGPAVQQAIDWADEQLPDVRRRLAMAEALEQEPAPGWPAGYVEMADDTAISTVPPDEAKQNGIDAAEALLSGDGDLDPELAAEIQANMNDPYFADGFASAASPEELSDVIWEMNNKHQWLGSDENPNGEDRATYLSLLEGIGGTLGTATRNVGTLALPNDYGQQWVDVLTSGPEDHKDEAGTERGGHPQALAVLLGEGTYSTEFLDHVSTELYNFERSFDGEPVWGPRAEDPMAVTIWDGTGRPASDVMPYVMTALGNNPQAAQNFFNGGDTVEVEINGEKVQINERLQYLIQDRTWRPGHGSDDGSGLGAALEAATTHFRDRTENGQISAQIASQTFALIGDKTGEGSGGNWYALGLDADAGWQMWGGMRDNVANMMADYAPDLLQMATMGEGGNPLGGDWHSENAPGFPDGMPYGAIMDIDLMARIMGTLGTDQDHVNTVLSGAYVAQQLSMSGTLDSAIQQNPDIAVLLVSDQSPDLIDNAASMGANGLGWIINAAYQGDADDEELQKKKAQTWANVLNAASVAPFVPKIEGEWLQWGVDQAKAQALNAIKNAPDADANAVYGQLSDETTNKLVQNSLNQLLQAGYLDQSVYDAANQGTGGPYKSPYEFEGLVDPGPPPTFNFDADPDSAFGQWYIEWAPRSWLQNEVRDPYKDEFPDVG